MSPSGASPTSSCARTLEGNSRNKIHESKTANISRVGMGDRTAYRRTYDPFFASSGDLRNSIAATESMN
jgi:hypothetical protein